MSMSKRRERWTPLKCGYIDSKKVNRLSFAAETLFVRLIACCDDNSNFDGDPTLLACKLFAERMRLGTVSVPDVERMRAELVANELVIPYEVDGESYLHIPNNRKVLRADIKPDIRFPDIPEDIKKQWFTSKKELQNDMFTDDSSESVSNPYRIRTENGSSYTSTITETDTNNALKKTLSETVGAAEKEKSDHSPIISYSSVAGSKRIFQQAYDAYEGPKRGVSTEFIEFRSCVPDWAKVLPLLLPSIEKQNRSRRMLKANDRFVPELKHFRNWLRDRDWEMTTEVDRRTEEKTKARLEYRDKKIKEDIRLYGEFVRTADPPTLRLKAMATPSLLEVVKVLRPEVLSDAKAGESRYAATTF